MSSPADRKIRRINPSDSENNKPKMQRIPNESRNPPMMKEYFRTGEFSEYEIAVGSGTQAKMFNVHKFVLVHNSLYFQKLFSTKNNSFTEIKDNKSEFNDRQGAMMERVLRFLYGEGITISNINDGVQLLEYAEHFCIPSLKFQLFGLLRPFMTPPMLSRDPDTADLKVFLLGILQVFRPGEEDSIDKGLWKIVYVLRNRRVLAGLFKQEEVNDFLSRSPDIASFIMVSLADC